MSVHFRQPDFGMKDYEILSRASAFLLGVDPPLESDSADGPYGHLEAAERKRKAIEFKRKHRYSQPLSGSSGQQREIMELGWLEFVPREVRPKVHVVCSSHVLSPFLWKDYYPQDWLSRVRQEHCSYTLEVYDSDREENPEEPLAKLALNSEPFHHPEGRDIALIHFREEDSSLKLLKKVGVDMLHLRDPEKLFQKGEKMVFDGFVVSVRNKADSEDFGSGGRKQQQQPQKKEGKKEGEPEEDLRVFYPYRETGKLAFHTEDRFFATTPEPLPEGLCGAPVLDADDDLCGVVEGIVPVDHKDKRLAGSAAFMPSYMMKAFVDYVERGLLEQMMPKDLFQMVVTAKKTNSIGGGVFKADKDTGKYSESDWEEAYDMALGKLKERHSPEEFDAIMKTVERERKEVLEIMDKEGGDLDETIKRVRLKTLEMREMIRNQYSKAQQQEQHGEGETIKSPELDEDDAKKA